MLEGVKLKNANFHQNGTTEGEHLAKSRSELITKRITIIVQLDLTCIMYAVKELTADAILKHNRKQSAIAL